jgi:hypothetical protein
VLDALGEVPQSQLDLEPREVSAEAHVLSHTKGQVTVAGPLDAELEGFVEDLFVAIRRWIEERERVASRDACAPDLHIFRSGSGVVDDR